MGCPVLGKPWETRGLPFSLCGRIGASSVFGNDKSNITPRMRSEPSVVCVEDEIPLCEASLRRNLPARMRPSQGRLATEAVEKRVM